MDEIIEENVAKQTAYLLGEQSGIEKGLEKGISQGILENKKEMVINLYQENIPIDIISKTTKLSTLEINEIINSRED